MKRQIIFLSLMISWCSYGQHSEFQVYENGLIYSEVTMNKLGLIVDSLNLKFKTCDLSHPYYSLAQGMATRVKVRNKEALRMMESGTSLDEYRNRFPGSIQEELWITKSYYRDYKNNRFIEYSGLPFGWGNETSITVKHNRENNKNSGWVVNRDQTEAFHFIKLQHYELPYAYARLVQYVDCMIDTTATIFFPQAYGAVYQQIKKGTRADEFMSLARNYPNEPSYPDLTNLEGEAWKAAYETFSKKRMAWDSLRLLHLDEQMNIPRWKNLLAEAAAESIEHGNSSSEFEFYVSRYLSKETALQLKRSRKVVGNCSQDLSPRFHAMEICQLAAETTQWDIFLRSHLDIMNDRFERMSDGSYAWEGRKTYLKELEALDIPAVDLLLGTCLRVDNVSENHYFSSIGRTGRALTDADDKPALEARLLAMIRDDKLDPYNRLLITYLFSNYAYSFDNKEQTQTRLNDLGMATNDLPDFVKTVWKKN